MRFSLLLPTDDFMSSMGVLEVIHRSKLSCDSKRTVKRCLTCEEAASQRSVHPIATERGSCSANAIATVQRRFSSCDAVVFASLSKMAVERAHRVAPKQ
jgi:hypothetical protein